MGPKTQKGYQGPNFYENKLSFKVKFKEIKKIFASEVLKNKIIKLKWGCLA